jgi:hypothetical protein
MRMWNNLHQIRAKTKDGKRNNIKMLSEMKDVDLILFH